MIIYNQEEIIITLAFQPQIKCRFQEISSDFFLFQHNNDDAYRQIQRKTLKFFTKNYHGSFRRTGGMASRIV